MADATVDANHDRLVYDYEYVDLDVNEGDTYVTKLSHPIGVHITNREDSDAIVNYTLSGRTITFHESSGSGVKVFVTIIGRK